MGMVVTGRKKGADLMIKFLKNRIIAKLWVIPAVVLALTVFLTVTYGDAVKINKHSPRKKYEILYGIHGRAVSLKVLQIASFQIHQDPHLHPLQYVLPLSANNSGYNLFGHGCLKNVTVW